MNENINSLDESRSLEEIAHDIATTTPRLVGPLTPTDATFTKIVFLNGTDSRPFNRYDQLLDTDFDGMRQSQLEAREEIRLREDMPYVYRDAYEKAINENVAKVRLLELANEYNQSETQEQRAALREEYSDTNVELYGEPDKEALGSIVHDILARCNEKQGEPDSKISAIARELSDLLPHPSAERGESYTPNPETVKWANRAVESLFGGLLSHVDESKESYTASELRDLFEQIIRDEFGEVADNWKVELSADAKSIEVKRLDEVIVIPAGRADAKIDTVKGLVVHEIGIHMLRTVSGAETDLVLMKTGYANYADTEEGMGVVAEQALRGGYKESGVNLFLAASLAHYHQKNFREVHEILWRKNIIESLADPTDEQINDAKSKAYGVAQRIFRGTDELPWLKDTTYLMGARKIWQHLDRIQGDDFALSLMFMGKVDPANKEHQRVLLETRSV